MVKILIVEDDALTCLDLKIRLENMGYQVIGFASTYDEALRYSFASDPDIILMDISIGGISDGIDAADTISVSLDKPIIYITGHYDQETRKRANKIKKSFYLTKPYSEALLHASIDFILAEDPV